MRLTAERTDTESLFETLANESPVGICIIQDGKFCYTNPTFQHNTGYREDELLGRNSLELVIPEDRKMARENAIKMLKGELTLPHQFRVMHKDGSIHWVIESVTSVQYRGKRAVLGNLVDITEHKQTEEALQAEKNKLQSLINTLEDHITIRDRDYNLIYMADHAKKLWGDRTGEKCYRVLEGQDKVCDGCPVKKAFKDGKSHTSERKTVTPSGEIIFWETRANPIRDAGGKIVACLEIARNITDQKQMVEALQTERTKLQSLIDAIDYTITIQDKEYNIIYQNEPSKIASGGDHVGEKCYRAYEGRKKVCDGCPVEETFKDGKTHTAERMTKISGKVAFWENTAVPIRDAKGKIVSCMELARDVTERKQAEEVLQMERNKLRSVIDAMQDGLTIQDRDYNIIFLNEVGKRLWGERLGEKCYQVYEGRESICEDCPVEQAFKDGKSHTAERRVVTPSGEVSFWENTANPIRDASGEIVSCLEINRKITERKQAEEALQAERNKLQSVIDGMQDGLTIQDRDYNIIFQNELTKRLWGERMGEKCYRAYEGREGICEDCPVEQAFKDGKSHTAEKRVVAPSGEVSFWENTANPIRDASGMVVSCVEIGRNITERRKQEQALADELTQRRLLIDKSLDGIVVLDEDAKVVEANQRFADMLGYTLEEVYKLHTWDWDKEFPPEKLLEMGRNVDEKGLHLETKHVRKDGSVFDVDISISGIMCGGRKLIFCIDRDITERKQAKEVLQAERNKLQSVIDAMADALTIQDAEYNILFQNEPSKIIYGDHLGEKCYRIYAGRESKCEDCPVEESFKDGKSRTVEREKTLPSGKAVFWELTANPIRDARGRIVACLEIGRDVTERKQQEQALADELTRRRLLVDQSVDGIVVIDENDKVYEANQRFAEMLGYTPEEVRELHTWDWEKNFSREQIHELGRKADEKGFLLETTHTRKDGSIIDVDISINASMVGGQKLIFCVCRDVTERKKAERALADELTRRRILVDQSLDGIVVLDVDAKVVEANQRFAEMLGYTPEEVRELHTWDWDKNFPPEEILEMGRNVDEKGLHLETKHTRKDGSVIDVDISINAAMFGEQKLIFCVCRDITERKRAEEAVNLQRAYFQQLFDNSPDAILMTDMNGKIIQGNRGFEVLFGYSNEEVKGRSLIELIVPEVDVQEASDSFQKISAGEVIRKESVRRRKDGSLVDVSVLAYPIRSKGELIGLYGIYSDITERKRAEEALRLAAEEWRETFDSITDAISIHDKDYKIMRANKAFADIFHLKPSQLIGKHCYELHKGDKPISGCPQKQTLATGKPATSEFYEPHLERYLLESTSPIFDKEGEVIGVVHITRDVTERKQQNERLMMADRLASVGELAAGTAHELNNPLTSVIGFSQLLLEKDIPDDIREDLQLVQSEAQRAANVTKNLLTFARKQAPVKQLNQINNIIEDVLKLRAYEHKVNGIEVKKQLAPDLPEIMIDYFQMQQVFLNIIINAEYFMTEEHNRGTLTITTKKQNGNVMISFADDGPGIPPENLSRIFDPFFTTKVAGKGTGLGLSICHGIVSEHGGQIYARNQRGQGAIIFIELPINSHDHIRGMP